MTATRGVRKRRPKICVRLTVPRHGRTVQCAGDSDRTLRRAAAEEKIAVAKQMDDSKLYTVEQIAGTLGVARGTIYQHLDRAPAELDPAGA